MNDPDTAAVDGRLKRMDGEAWASQAHKASRSELREMLSDMIEQETDDFYQEKNKDAEFHPWRVMKYTDPDWVPPETELYKPLSEKSKTDWGVLYGKTSAELKEDAKNK